MPYGGYYRGGMGLGFRGSSPPWPYVGRGRGGLPRCGYFWGEAAALYPTHLQTSYTQTTTSEQELECLREESDAIKRHLERIESRMRDLEAGK